MKPNWPDIERCSIWKVLGVIECNYCSSVDECWVPEMELERMPKSEEMKEVT